MLIYLFITLFLLSLSTFSYAENIHIYSFSTAKKTLEKKVYIFEEDRVTLYCEAKFNEDKNIIAPAGFESDKYKKRAKRIEWEHVVPAENFGRNFREWREGHKECVNSKKIRYKGRRCAEKINAEYRYMQADMYNLYPAIGSVNASRSNYNFAMLGNIQNSFGSCAMKIENKKAEPPISSRGVIARTYLYMDATYSNYKMSRQQRQLMTAWHVSYPVKEWECDRAQRIKGLQHNANDILEESCSAANF